MAQSKLNGFWAMQPTKGSTLSQVVLSFVSSFDPTSTGQVSLGTLPKGGRPLGIDSFGGATGGTNPTVDIGTAVDPDGFANELDADDVAFNDFGALTGIALTTDTEVFGIVGAAAATGGTTTVLIKYTMA